jgi:hypothetical protein
VSGFLQEPWRSAGARRNCLLGKCQALSCGVAGGPGHSGEGDGGVQCRLQRRLAIAQVFQVLAGLADKLMVASQLERYRPAGGDKEETDDAAEAYEDRQQWHQCSQQGAIVVRHRQLLKLADQPALRVLIERGVMFSGALTGIAVHVCATVATQHQRQWSRPALRAHPFQAAKTSRPSARCASPCASWPGSAPEPWPCRHR